MMFPDDNKYVLSIDKRVQQDVPEQPQDMHHSPDPGFQCLRAVGSPGLPEDENINSAGECDRGKLILQDHHVQGHLQRNTDLQNTVQNQPGRDLSRRASQSMSNGRKQSQRNPSPQIKEEMAEIDCSSSRLHLYISMSLGQKKSSVGVRETNVKSFMVEEPIYDMTPPPPIAYPKLIHYSLDPTRHFHHRLLPSYLLNSKPLLIGCDVGLPIDELVLFAQDYSHSESALDPQDAALLKESIMDATEN